MLVHRVSLRSTDPGHPATQKIILMVFILAGLRASTSPPHHSMEIRDICTCWLSHQRRRQSQNLPIFLHCSMSRDRGVTGAVNGNR